jgi:hypothetical protein
MSEAFVNKVTLDCLLNKSLFNQQIKNKMSKISNKEDIKFYRKRIYNLFKELLTTNEREDICPDVKYAYDNFVNSSINYFKTIDNNDLLQEDYKDLDETKDIPELNIDNIKSEEEANKLLMRSIKVNMQPLDKFVKRKNIKPPDQIILPKQKEINLTDPELKIKGINKKKNITNKYDEINNSKKEDKKD